MQQNAQPVRRTSGLAIASLVLAVVGPFLFLVPTLVGLILGIVALVGIRRSQGRLTGEGLAIAGICVSGISVMLIPIMMAMLFPVFARARESARKIQCLSNTKNVSLAISMFANEKGVYPNAATWCDDIAPYLRNPRALVCPDAPNLRCGYAYNAALSGAPTTSVAADTVAIFESDRGWNASGTQEQMLPVKPRHVGGDNFGYADGSAQWTQRPGFAVQGSGAQPWMGDVLSRSRRAPGVGRSPRGPASLPGH